MRRRIESNLNLYRAPICGAARNGMRNVRAPLMGVRYEPLRSLLIKFRATTRVAFWERARRKSGQKADLELSKFLHRICRAATPIKRGRPAYDASFFRARKLLLRPFAAQSTRLGTATFSGKAGLRVGWYKIFRPLPAMLPTFQFKFTRSRITRLVGSSPYNTAISPRTWRPYP